MAAITDLDRLLAQMSPRLDPEPWVFATSPCLPAGVVPLMTFAEDEGLTLVLPAEQARALELAASGPMARITLLVHSALDAVGLTAAVSTALAEAGISCNVVAGYFHDHLFVPERQGQQALSVLEALATTSSS